MEKCVTKGCGNSKKNAEIYLQRQLMIKFLTRKVLVLNLKRLSQVYFWLFKEYYEI